MKKLMIVVLVGTMLCLLPLVSNAYAYNSSFFSSHKETCQFSVSGSGDVFDGSLGAETCRGSKALGENVKSYKGKRIDASYSVTKWNLTASYGFHVIDVTTVYNGSLATYGYDY